MRFTAFDELHSEDASLQAVRFSEGTLRLGCRNLCFPSFKVAGATGELRLFGVSRAVGRAFPYDEEGKPGEGSALVWVDGVAEGQLFELSFVQDEPHAWLDLQIWAERFEAEV